MSRELDDSAIEALAACKALGFSPKPHPMGDDHHTDARITDEDAKIGDALAYFLGGLFVDKETGWDPGGSLYRDSYFYKEMTSVDVWTRVARALRIHGLAVTNRESR